jgi:hypothetical protein
MFKGDVSDDHNISFEHPPAFVNHYRVFPIEFIGSKLKT